jgi:Leucine-rich repeat (LRR) protein
MKKLFYSFSLLFIVIAAQAQTPIISMTTTLSINSQITIGLSGNTSSTPIQIDWGNGVKENFTIGSTMEFFGYPVKGNTIKIWGAGITGLNIQSKNIAVLEFFDATLLKSLFCKNNQISTLNLSSCTALEFVECKQNLISNITLPSTTTLTYVDCSDNNLTLATLPIKQGTWTDYIYSPQKDYTLAKKLYAVNEEIDLSNQLTINGNTTTYTWKTKGGITLVNGTDYSSINGKVTFLKTKTDSVYCEMTNATFPSLTLRTISISIPTLPAVVMNTTTAIGSLFSFGISGAVNNTSIQVDWGNGTLTNYTIGTSYSNVSSTLIGNTIKIYGVGISNLQLQSKNLTALDISGASALKTLECYSNQLTTLDVTKNTALTILSCTSNQLTTLDVSKNNELTELYCSSNELISIDLSINTKLTELNCSRNKLTGLDLSMNTALTSLECGLNELITLDVFNNTALRTLSCYANKLTTLDVSKNTMLTYIYCVNNLLTALNVSNNTILTDLLCSHNQLTALDLSKNSALTYLNCSNNQLTALDVAKNTALTTLYCSWNKLTALDVSINTSLETLNCSINQLTALDVSKNTALTYLNCSSNPLSSLDVSTNTSLTTLLCYSNQLSTLDVSMNANLTTLKCSGNKLTSLDISKNTILTELDCGSNQLTSLDLSKNGQLTILMCNWNKFTLLDLSMNTKLRVLKCYDNKLTILDVSKNTALIDVQCRFNLLKFSTLPVKQPTWTNFEYTPQGSIKLSKIQYAVNEQIDLSSEMTVNGTNTDYIWKTLSGKTLTKGVDYSDNNGRFTFPNPQSDYIYCEMTNATFPGLNLTTEMISVSSANPAITMKTTVATGSTFSFWIVATTSTPIQVDWGNGTLTDYTIGTSSSNISNTLSGNTIKIYGVCISDLFVQSKNLTTLDISGATTLKKLHCYANQLVALDVSKNTALTELSCSSNHLTALDLSMNTALTYIDCESNLLNFVTLPIKQSTWTTYNYSPQKAIALQKKNYTLSETIDLSSQLTANGNTTSYVWKTKGGTTLTLGNDYNTTNGITTFLKENADSVYCQMTNASFPSLTLSTTNVKVTQFPTSIDETSLAINIYPNPIKENLNIELEENITRVEVYSLTGVKVYEMIGNNTNSAIISAENLPKGMIIVKVFGRNGVIEKKIVKE